MLLPALTLLFATVAAVLALPILRHAYGRSVGTGVMVTFIPGYFLMYAFSQFEHSRRHWLVPALVGAIILAGVFGGLAATGLSVRAEDGVPPAF
jgi:hypothetical protein